MVEGRVGDSACTRGAGQCRAAEKSGSKPLTLKLLQVDLIGTVTVPTVTVAKVVSTSGQLGRPGTCTSPLHETTGATSMPVPEQFAIGSSSGTIPRSSWHCGSSGSHSVWQGRRGKGTGRAMPTLSASTVVSQRGY